jgi:tetratricopeptide (TPR) repeat protein
MSDFGGEREVRVFISSPTDVGAERARAALVLRELSAEFAGQFRLVPVLWEENYYSAHRTFQDTIPKPSSCDIVVCILWKRLGTELPPEYNRADGTPRTGTEYEFEEALEAALRREVPDIFVYRKRVLVDVDRLGQEAAALRALNAFWQRWCNDAQGNFTASFDRFATDEEFQDKLKRQLRLWLGRLGHAVTWNVSELGSPFRGLAAFDATHARVFFGRRRAVRQAFAKLTAAAARGCAFLLVLGGSGTGKSSLISAGLIPFLISERASREVALWRSATVRPASLGTDMLLGFSEALLGPDAAPERGGGGGTAAQDLAARMRAAPAAAASEVAVALGAMVGTPQLVLLVDQIEEILLRAPGERTEFITVLDALARCGAVWVIATLRSDRYGELQGEPGLVRLKADGETLDLLPPGPAEIRDIIERPARAAGLHFEESGDRNLAALLEAAAQERGALPLLQFTLQALFAERDVVSGTLKLSVYDRLGGLVGAIAGEAERLVAALATPAQAALPGLLLKLVDIAEGTDVAAARTLDYAAVTNPAERDLVASLTDGRLLTLDGDGAFARVRLAHEALLTGWPRLAALVSAHRDFLAVRSQLDVAAAAWLAQGRDDDLLLPSGRRLTEAADAVGRHRATIGADAVALVEASLAAERRRLEAAAAATRHELEQRAAAAEAAEQESRRLFRRTRTAVTIVSVMLIFMVGLAALWLDQREVARRRAAEAEQNYTVALQAASQTLAILARGEQAGRVTAPFKNELLGISAAAFQNLPSENESPAATKTRAHLFIALASSNDPLALEHGSKAVKLARALVAHDPDDADAQSLLQEALWQLGSRMAMQGDVSGAATHLMDAETIARQWTDARPNDAAWRNKLSADQRAVADILRRRGDLSGALARYRASDDRVGEGDVLLTQGKPVAAMAAYRGYLDAMTARAKRTGANANIERGLAQAHAKVGDALRVEGDLDGALREYDSAAELCHGLFQNLLGNFGLVRVQFAATRGAADMALARHDAAGALRQYQAIKELVRKRIGIAPRMPEWQAEQGEIDERIGDAQIALGDLSEAEGSYRAALRTAEGVTRVADGDTSWQRDIELAHGRLGGVLRAKGDLAGAAAEYHAQIDLANRLVQRDASNADWQRDLALAWAGLGAIAAARHAGDEAAAAFARCAATPVVSALDPRDELARDPREGCRNGAPR